MRQCMFLLQIKNTDLELFLLPQSHEEELTWIYLIVQCFETLTFRICGFCCSEELQTFMISMRQQCCYMTETIQDVISHFPQQASQVHMQFKRGCLRWFKWVCALMRETGLSPQSVDLLWRKRSFHVVELSATGSSQVYVYTKEHRSHFQSWQESLL